MFNPPSPDIAQQVFKSPQPLFEKEGSIEAPPSTKGELYSSLAFMPRMGYWGDLLFLS